MKTILGLTGSIASGKSTVSRILREKGVFVIDSDQIVHELLEGNQEIIQEIAHTFGSEYLVAGKVNRKALGKLIFSQEEKRFVLNQIIHPKVKERIEIEIAQSSETLIVIDVPLLFETDFYQLCDYTIVVYVDLDQQILRLQQRDKLEFIEALKRIRAQEPLETKMQKADFVIDNRFRPEDLNWQIDILLSKFGGI